jgi:hypothetical protein
MSAWTLLPVLLLSPQSVRLPPRPVRWVVGAAAAFPLICVAASPGVAYLLFVRGFSPDQTQSKQLTQLVEAAWHAATNEPLRYVGGDVGYGVVAYAKDRPQALQLMLQSASLRLRRSGMALICYAGDRGCLARASARAAENPKSKRFEMQIVSTFFGAVGPSQAYVIFIIPPAL